MNKMVYLFHCFLTDLSFDLDLDLDIGEFDHVEYQGKQVKCRSSCEDQVWKMNLKIKNQGSVAERGGEWWGIWKRCRKGKDLGKRECGGRKFLKV